MKVFYIKRGLYPVLGFIVVFLLMLGYFTLELGGKAIDTITNDRKIPIYCTDNKENNIALTFDCGSGASDIPQIMEILKKADVKATFFVLGIWAEQNPEALKLIYENGHEIANHSYSHKAPSKLTKEQMEVEIDKCNDAIEKIIGIRPTIYRAPSADYNNLLIKTATEKGMYTVQWNVDSIDWQKQQSREKIINRITGKTKSGSILLFHNETQHTVSVLPEILDHLKSEGYKFQIISNLIYKQNYLIDDQGIQKLKN